MVSSMGPILLVCTLLLMALFVVSVFIVSRKKRTSDFEDDE